jgi:haloalkane dehalogenase
MMIHGSPISSYGFRHQIESLKSKYRIIAPDLPNFGQSEGPENGASFLESAELLAEFFLHPALDIDFHNPISLAVHNWGGPIGLGALALCDLKDKKISIDRLMLINTGFRPDFNPPWYWPFRFKYIGDFLITRLNVFSFGLKFLMKAVKRAKLTRKNYKEPLQMKRTRRTACKLEQLIGYRDLTKLIMEYLESQSIPCYIFWGEPEPYFSKKDIKFFQEIFPKIAGIQIVKNAGHFPMEDAPESLTDAMNRFF